MMANITVRTYGKTGTPVVVLHGTPGSATEIAHGLSHDFMVFEPLQRHSQKKPLTVMQHINDLANIFPQQATIVGWSWGAMLGLSFAACHPDKISALVLAGCNTHDEAVQKLIQSVIVYRLADTEKQRLQKLMHLFNTTFNSAEKEKKLKEISKLISKTSIYEACSDNSAESEDLPTNIIEHLQIHQDISRLQKEKIEQAPFNLIRAPVLMIHGDTDPHPGIKTRETLRKYIPHLEYISLEHYSHAPWQEQHTKSLFFKILTDWIKKKTIF